MEQMFWHVKASIMSSTDSIQKAGYLWHLGCEGGTHTSPLHLSPTVPALEVGLRPRS